MKKNDLLVISERIPPDFAGGGKRAYNQSKYIASLGYQVNILTFTKNMESIENLKISTVPEIRKFSKNKYNRLLSIPIQFSFIIQHLLLNKPKIVYSLNVSYLAYMVLICCKLLNIKVIVGTTLVDNDDPLTIKHRVLGSLKFKIFNFAERIICISPSLAERCKIAGINQERIILIPNPVDVNTFFPLTEEERNIMKKSKGFNDSDIIMLNVGIIIERKRTAYIVEIFNELAKLDENYKLVILGPTNKNDENKQYSEKIIRLISDFNLEDRVFIKGNVKDVNSYMQISDLFLFASQQEGFGNVLIEAMACGLPVISTNIPGITDYIIENGINGYNVNSREDFFNSILSLLQNKEKYNSVKLNCRKEVVNRFSYKKVMQQYFDIFNEVLGKEYFVQK